jgi:hypothetical protein
MIALVLTGSLIFFGEIASAQVVRSRPGLLRPNRRIEQQPPDDQPPGQNPARRQMLEQQIRRTFWRVAKNRIGFTEEQMTRLERISQRFDQRRRVLAQQERLLRVAMRREILSDSSANQGAIATALDQLQALQRQRLDLQEEEQREFSAFMTPLQRAKFLALQEQVRKRMQELVRARPDSGVSSLRVDP